MPTKPITTGAQQRRADLETLHQWSKENEVDPKSLILLLQEISINCTVNGYLSEKVAGGSGEILAVIERFPGIAVNAIAQIHKIQTDLQKELDKAPPADPVINIILSRKRLEDVLEEKSKPE